MATQHYLPSKVLTYLRRLQLEYDRTGLIPHRDILNSCHVFVRQETAYDNWNGGTNGHDVLLFVPPIVMRTIPLHAQNEISEQLCDALNLCAKNVENEFFRAVSLEIHDEADSAFQRAVPISTRPQLDPDTLALWSPGQIRLFITHRDEHKTHARALADELERFGISAFVAHDTIRPMEDWKTEILKGLETMEVMLVFLTDNFHQSTWTNQEVGFALGKAVPIITLKLERADPLGFISSDQALRGSLDNPNPAAIEIYRLLSTKVGQRTRLQRALVASFAASPSFDEARSRFDRLASCVEGLTADEEKEIVQGFATNSHLNKAYYLKNSSRLTEFLRKTTGKRYDIEMDRLVGESEPVRNDEIPF